jgi:alanyl-tRNA synthetase
MVNRKIRENITKTEERNVPIQVAINKGAMALFGEKYGDSVRVITFDPNYSVELCGGTHVESTGSIGFFKITSEGSVAAGIRRIEAITADKAESFVNEEFAILNEIRLLFKTAGNPLKQIHAIVSKNTDLEKEIEKYKSSETNRTLESLLNKKNSKNGVDIIASTTNLDADSIRNIAFSLKKTHSNLAVMLASVKEGKANITVFLTDDLLEKGHNAVQIIKDISVHIQGGGGGQPFLATAGGKNPDGISNAISAFEEIW